MSSSCCEVLSKPTAEVMLDGEDFKNTLINLKSMEGLLPNLNQILSYNMYKIRGQEIGAHESIVLELQR